MDVPIIFLAGQRVTSSVTAIKRAGLIGSCAWQWLCPLFVSSVTAMIRLMDLCDGTCPLFHVS